MWWQLLVEMKIFLFTSKLFIVTGNGKSCFIGIAKKSFNKHTELHIYTMLGFMYPNFVIVSWISLSVYLRFKNFFFLKFQNELYTTRSTYQCFDLTTFLQNINIFCTMKGWHLISGSGVANELQFFNIFCIWYNQTRLITELYLHEQPKVPYVENICFALWGTWNSRIVTRIIFLSL